MFRDLRARVELRLCFVCCVPFLSDAAALLELMRRNRWCFVRAVDPVWQPAPWKSGCHRHLLFPPCLQQPGCPGQQDAGHNYRSPNCPGVRLVLGYCPMDFPMHRFALRYCRRRPRPPESQTAPLKTLTHRHSSHRRLAIRRACLAGLPDPKFLRNLARWYLPRRPLPRRPPQAGLHYQRL